MKGKFEVFLRFSVKLPKLKVKGEKFESILFHITNILSRTMKIKKGTKNKECGI